MPSHRLSLLTLVSLAAVLFARRRLASNGSADPRLVAASPSRPHRQIRRATKDGGLPSGVRATGGRGTPRTSGRIGLADATLRIGNTNCRSVVGGYYCLATELDMPDWWTTVFHVPQQEWGLGRTHHLLHGQRGLRLDVLVTPADRHDRSMFATGAAQAAPVALRRQEPSRRLTKACNAGHGSLTERS